MRRRRPDTGRRRLHWPPLRLIGLAMVLAWFGLVTETAADAVAAPAALSIVWTTDVGADSVDASVACVGDTVIAGTTGGALVALAVEDGHRLWSLNAAQAAVSALVAGQGRVFASSADGCLYAVDAFSGQRLWRCRTRGSLVAPPAISGGILLFGSMDGTFRAVDAVAGSFLWSVTGAAPITGAATCGEGLVYYGDEAGSLFARDVGDGHLRWSTAHEAVALAAPCVTGSTLAVPFMSRTALTPPLTRYLISVDAATGDERWSLSGQSSVLHTPVSDGDRVYYATVSGYLSETVLTAVDLADGAVAWRLPLPRLVDAAPALWGEHLLVCCHDGLVRLVDAGDGQVEASVDLGARTGGAPTVRGDLAFVGAQDGRLRCIRLQHAVAPAK